MNTETFIRWVTDILKERQAVYGNPTASLTNIAQRWSITLGIEISAAQVALAMIDLKLARLKQTPAHLDSILDIAGYAACLSEIVTKGEDEKVGNCDENTGSTIISEK